MEIAFPWTFEENSQNLTPRLKHPSVRLQPSPLAGEQQKSFLLDNH